MNGGRAFRVASAVADASLRRRWLERSVAQGWTPQESRFLLRAATKPEKPCGPFLWAPTWYPL